MRRHLFARCMTHVVQGGLTFQLRLGSQEVQERGVLKHDVYHASSVAYSRHTSAVEAACARIRLTDKTSDLDGGESAGESKSVAR